jgi:NTE family protein
MPAGIFDSTPMERYLARALSTGGRTNDFRRLDTVLRIVSVRLDTAELVVFGDEATAHVPISKAVQASSALPGLYCPVRIDGEWYIDGVARRTLHASRVLDAGVEMLFCINPIVPVDMRVGDGRTLVDYGLPAVLSQTFRTMIQSRMNTAFRSYEHTHPDADILLIEPEMTDHRMFFSNVFSFRTRREVCEHAYASTRRFLRANREAVEAKLARHGLRLRHEVLDDESRRLFRAEPRTTLGSALGEMRGTIGRLEAALERLGRAA